jgi:hypothetical protein
LTLLKRMEWPPYLMVSWFYTAHKNNCTTIFVRQCTLKLQSAAAQTCHKMSL